MQQLYDWLRFQMMRVGFALRDHVVQPGQVLSDIGLEEGQTVLDFGCGPGSYVFEAARLVGPQGTVYAADRNIVAVHRIEHKAEEYGFTHVIPLQTEAQTTLPDGSVGVVLLFDVYHELEEPGRVRAELHRVLKPDGLLAVSDHHMEREELERALTADGLFRLQEVRDRTYLLRPGA